MEKSNELYAIIDLFNKRRQEVIEILEKQFGTIPKSGLGWSFWSSIHYNKLQSFKDDFKLFPHGYGLTFSNDEFWIDFDFGENGKIKGFDAKRLWVFIEKNNVETDFLSSDEIEKIIKFETKKGKLVLNGDINYYIK
ncbi:hypothetical protein [Flagellimonas sp. S3867]|uniref:DUF6896 domain-containing protein n=1 Tax=Flagellimonas sp. S3867 TaxID=2768063 RepID=UPI00168A2E69|nr:hypothetical protein [Flagellimonas sp. S3867]